MGSDFNRPAAQDVAFAAVYAGAVGSGAIALLFLLLDILAGQPLATPSILGSALFLGVPAGATGPVRIDMIAAFSLVHFTAFAAVGTGFALIAARAPGLRSRPLGLGYAIFAVLSVGVVLIDRLLPGALLDTIGIFEVLAGNAVAAGAMTYLYREAFSGSSAAAMATSRVPGS